MSGVRGDARKRQQGEHLTHWDAGVRAVIEREVAKERERTADWIAERIDTHAATVRDAIRIAREAGTQ